ncbi:MAG: hypothetical protein KAQ99_08790 [Candidatus Aureabacteria bacterium]|nr:hypothetical protein [Candidatus Auribacterota bacterium]
MAKEKIKDLLYWLELVLKLAEKEKARLHQAGNENLGLGLDYTKIPNSDLQKHFRKYLLISTKDRMAINDTLIAQEIKVDFAIKDIQSIIYYEKLRRGKE